MMMMMLNDDYTCGGGANRDGKEIDIRFVNGMIKETTRIWSVYSFIQNIRSSRITVALAVTYISHSKIIVARKRERVNTMGFIVSTIEQFHNYSIGRIERTWQYKERQWQWQWQWQHTMTT